MAPRRSDAGVNVSDSGTVGDAKMPTREKGAAVMTEAIENLVRVLREA